MKIFYLDVAEVTSRPVTVITLRRNELAADVFATGTQGSSSMNVKTVTAGLQTVDDTTDFNGAVDRTLLHHDFATDVHTINSDDGTTGSIASVGRSGSDTSDDNNWKTYVSY